MLISGLNFVHLWCGPSCRSRDVPVRGLHPPSSPPGRAALRPPLGPMPRSSQPAPLPAGNSNRRARHRYASLENPPPLPLPAQVPAVNDNPHPVHPHSTPVDPTGGVRSGGVTEATVVGEEGSVQETVQASQTGPGCRRRFQIQFEKS